MHADIERILIPQDQIARRVRTLAEQITADHAFPGEITLIPILTGAMIFCADLMRHMPLAMKIGLMTVSSYPGKSLQSQGANVLSQQSDHIRGRHVLLVDDILDSGKTLEAVIPKIQALAPAGIKTCVLLRKNFPAVRDLSGGSDIGMDTRGYGSGQALDISPSPGTQGEGWGEGFSRGRLKTRSPALSRAYTGEGGRFHTPGRLSPTSVVTADYVGFDIPDEFVVGYGLDYDDYYRNLPDIVTLKPGVKSR